MNAESFARRWLQYIPANYRAKFKADLLTLADNAYQYGYAVSEEDNNEAD